MWDTQQKALIEVDKVVEQRGVESVIRRKKMLHKMLLQHYTSERKEEYRKVKVEAKRLVRKAKNEEWAKLGERMEKSLMANQREFWRWIKVSRKGDQGACNRLNSSTGEIITDEEGILDSWREHFEGLLRGEACLIPEEQNEETGSEGDEEISVEEVQKAMQKLKVGKAAGVCGISGEMVKTGGEPAVRWMTELCRMEWRCGKVPAEWRKAIIVPLHKKGSKLDCQNYRGIRLLSVPGKVYAKTLNERVKRIISGRIMELQGGSEREEAALTKSSP